MFLSHGCSVYKYTLPNEGAAQAWNSQPAISPPTLCTLICSLKAMMKLAKGSLLLSLFRKLFCQQAYMYNNTGPVLRTSSWPNVTLLKITGLDFCSSVTDTNTGL